MSKQQQQPSEKAAPRDGLDNTGTQGYDSLSDDAYTGSSKKPEADPNDSAHSESKTGSSSADFNWVGENGQE
ncbi:MAG: hypothetical protein REI78_04775 [Pedobacter sp.]|nr:hypothetical protein [Pedobacter sp.]MDQ8052312.1 hypothetical protein [Pedobacter sp.]